MQFNIPSETSQQTYNIQNVVQEGSDVSMSERGQFLNSSERGIQSVSSSINHNIANSESSDIIPQISGSQVIESSDNSLQDHYPSHHFSPDYHSSPNHHSGTTSMLPIHSDTQLQVILPISSQSEELHHSMP